MEGDYVCPSCKSVLTSEANRLSCRHCGVEYPVKDGIPDFIQEDLSKSKHSVLRSVSYIDKLAKIYETPMWYPIVYHFYGGLFIPSVKEEVNIITEMVDGEGGLDLDVACGTGLFTRSIAKRMRLVYGIDISMGMLEEAAKYAEKEEIENALFARASAEALPFAQGLFDGVICCGALHLFPDTEKALGEMARVMRKGARLAVMTFVRRRFLKYRWIYEYLGKDYGIHVFDEEVLDDYLSRAGFGDFKYNIYGSIVFFHAERK